MKFKEKLMKIYKTKKKTSITSAISVDIFVIFLCHLDEGKKPHFFFVRSRDYCLCRRRFDSLCQ